MSRARLALILGCVVIPACARSGSSPKSDTDAGSANQAANAVTQEMERFSMVGYAQDGAKRWELQGRSATMEGQIVSIKRPRGVGYEEPKDIPAGARARVAYLTASLAHVDQQTHRVRLEDRVTIHTADGLWFAAPTLYWIPDQDHVVTDQPVQLETDRMLLLGRGATAQTQLKEAVVNRDVELMFVPQSGPQGPGRAAIRPGLQAGRHPRVRITCDGPLSLYYERRIAVFERRVHVQDERGDVFSDRLIAYLDQARQTIRYAEAIGHVRIVQSGHVAHSERAVYDPIRGTVTLLGKPSVRVESHESGPGVQAPTRPAVRKPAAVPATAPTRPRSGEGVLIPPGR